MILFTSKTQTDVSENHNESQLELKIELWIVNKIYNILFAKITLYSKSIDFNYHLK